MNPPGITKKLSNMPRVQQVRCPVRGLGGPHSGRLGCAAVHKQASLVEATTIWADHKPLGHAERAHLRVRELGPPIHLALPITQPAADDAVALAALAALDPPHQRGSDPRQDGQEEPKEEEKERDRPCYLSETYAPSDRTARCIHLFSGSCRLPVAVILVRHPSCMHGMAWAVAPAT